MAFSSSGFGPLGGQSLAGNAPALYVYTTTDAHTDVDTGTAYFASMSDTLKVGDMIIVHGSTGGTRTVTMHIVTSVAAGAVGISNGTVIGVVTDTD